MKPEKIHEMIPRQPYLTVTSQDYRMMPEENCGISRFYEFCIAPGKRDALQAVPDGTVDLLYRMDEKNVRALIGGTVTAARDWPMDEEKTYFGVRFRPGRCVLPKELSIRDLIDVDMEIDGDCFGKGLKEQLLESRSLEERAHVFLRHYRKMLEGKPKADGIPLDVYVRNRIYESGGNVEIRSMVQETGYSECYIRRVFKDSHGISPKSFGKFVRFQNVLGQMKRGVREGGLDKVAMDCGYYDQSHMIKDFKRFAGTTPEAYCSMVTGKKVIR